MPVIHILCNNDAMLRAYPTEEAAMAEAVRLQTLAEAVSGSMQSPACFYHVHGVELAAPVSLETGLVEEAARRRAEANQWKERAEKAEALAAVRLAGYNDLEASYSKSVAGHKQQLHAARAEAEAAKQEAAGLRARKVKLPPSRVPLTDPQGHGDPYANGYSWGLLDCAAAIRAAGVEVEP